MFVVLTKGANEKPFVYDHQHGGHDVTCKSRILSMAILNSFPLAFLNQKFAIHVTFT